MDFKDAVIAHLSGHNVETKRVLTDGWCEFMPQFEETWLRDVDHPGIGKGWEFRIRSRKISINGVEVPEPLRVAPAYGTTVWMVSLPSWSAHTWLGNSNDQAWLRTGLLHATEEAARAHAEALLKCSAS